MILLRLLEPSKTVTFVLNCEPDNVTKRLSEFVEPGMRFVWFTRDHKPFEGEVERTYFHITRIIHYGQWFRPIIDGSVSAGPSGTIVTLTMRILTVTRLFYGFTLLFFLSVASVFTYVKLSK